MTPTMRYHDILLDPEEIEQAVSWIDEVRAAKDAFGVTDRKFDQNSSSWAVNVMGRLGEVAARKVLGGTLDESINPAGDDGCDLMLDGQRIQVKTSTTNFLIVNSLDEFVADRALLVQLCGDRVRPHDPATRWRLWGTVTRERFEWEHERRDWGYGLRYVMHANRLDRLRHG